MAMQMGLAVEGEPISEINTTPLIDVLLVLLVMILMVLPPPRHAVNLDTPFPCQDCPTDVRPEPVVIMVDFDGSYMWNGSRVTATMLDMMLAIEARRDKTREIHIQPHRMAEYGDVIHVMAAAQRLGLMRIGVLRAV